MSEDSVESGQEVQLLAFSNDKSPEHLEFLRGFLKMVYSSALTNRLAVMEARNVDTGVVEVIVVGVEQNESGLGCYPLFKPLTAEEAAKYDAPDGNGGFVGRTTE